METMNYITVLDFETGRVYQYKTMGEGTLDVKGWNPDFESIEDFLNSVGHNVNNCEWMVHSDHQVISRDAEWKRFTK